MTPTFTLTPTATSVSGAYAARIAVASDTTYIDTLGNYWMADQPYIQGGGAGWVVDAQPYFTTSAVIGTADPILYQNFAEDSAIEYKLDLAPGNYQVTLKMVNTDDTQPGQNVFSVLAYGTTVVPSLDLASTGYFNAYDVTFNFTVTGNCLDLVWSPTAGLATVSAIQVLGLQTIPVPSITTSPTPCTTYGTSWNVVNGESAMAVQWIGREFVHNDEWSEYRCVHDERCFSETVWEWGTRGEPV